MDSRLEKYLQTVEVELDGLREQQRESELREMRQHLEAIVARLVEGGLSREEAIEAATAQFGAARSVGRELRVVGEGREPLWRIVLAPVCGTLCATALSSVLLPHVDELAIKLAGSMSTGWWQYLAWSFVLSWPITLAAGAVAGFVSPRWGGRLMLGLASALFLASIPLGLLPMGALSPNALLSGGLLLMLLNIYSGVSLGSRWARRRSRRKTDAQRA